ncbi:MAG: hypothetical protein ABIJ09_22855 [Pseudomonadota bacterium]
MAAQAETQATAPALTREPGILDGVTLPMSLTYGLVDTFDVDVFATPRVYPQLDVLFGAGIRLRMFDLGSSLNAVFRGRDASTRSTPLDTPTRP